MKKNIIDKIWDSHVIVKKEGHPAILAIDFMLMHEVTSSQAFQTLKEKNLEIFDTTRILATLDHSIPTRKNRLEIYDEQAKYQVEELRRNAAKNNIPILDFDSGGQGIVHVIGPEQGFTQSGMTIVCGDSHTSTHGAFGALAFGIGTSEVGHVLATGCLLQLKPKSFKVNFSGKLPDNSTAKDIILYLISQIGMDGGNGYIIEYCGDAIKNLNIEERMTICNMSIECGARAGLISPDDITITYLRDKLKTKLTNTLDTAEAHWRSFASDEEAKYDRELTLDISSLSPMVTWGTNPGQAAKISDNIPKISDLPEALKLSAIKALEYQGLSEGQAIQGIPIDWAFIGSCTNGRISDLRAAAKILKGKKINPNVTMLVVPGSESVLKQAQEEGLIEIFENAGAQFRMPGCSMCLGMNDDKVPPGKRCISTSNRNFMGRQGPQSRTHLASPQTVARSAIKGEITI
jgi:3-isopropylmalate/(R)-2-methylmalate dehydratase large subunit